MNTYQWVCKACETPNVLVHDPAKREQVTLNCGNCGQPGHFNPITKSLTQAVHEPVLDTISTSSVDMQDLIATNVYIETLKPHVIGGPLSWTEW